MVDPFGTTVGREGSYGPPPPAPPLEPTNVSPLAASMVQPQYAPPPAPQYAPAPQYGAAPQAPPPAPHYAPAPQYGAAQPPPQYPLPQPPQFGAGARVLVQWADGNRYPAMVQQSAGAQCLVVFPNGQQQWVDAQYLSFG